VVKALAKVIRDMGCLRDAPGNSDAVGGPKKASGVPKKNICGAGRENLSLVTNSSRKPRSKKEGMKRTARTGKAGQGRGLKKAEIGGE